MLRTSLALLVPIIFTSTILAAPPDFDRSIAPILTACLDCHSGADAKGKLDMSRKASAFAGGKGGAGIVAGKLDASAIWAKVNDDEMPPKKPLSAADKATLKAWIDGGAKWGTDPIDPLAFSTTTRAGRDWWSLQPVQRPTGTNDIDGFIAAKLASNGLKPSPPADRRTLIRRLKFDLLGLPPTPEEVAAFVADNAPNAYAKLVDQYLASPQYGERWARHWLDTVRFAESHGFEMNNMRPNAWPYRDWVIKAFNDDKPYDRFVFEQLAGDTTGAHAGTGFLVAGPWDNVKSPDPELTANQRADELHDIVSTVGSTFLGLTVGCARCHNHKFDPIAQLDYYRIKAIFGGVQHGERELRTGDPATRIKQLDVLRGNIAALEAQVAALQPLADPTASKPTRAAVNSRMNIERFQPVKAKFVRFTIAATNSNEPCIDEMEIFTTGDQPKNLALAGAGAKSKSDGDYPNSPDIHRLAFLHDGKYGNGRSWISNKIGSGIVTIELAEVARIDRIVWGRDREDKYKDRTPTKYAIDVSVDGNTWHPVASSADRAAFGSQPEGTTEQKQLAALKAELASLHRSDRAYLGTFTAPEATHRFHRGDPMEKREVVPPGSLAGVSAKLILAADATDGARRVALADWIASPANPLTARVMVNRLWQHHFGTGLVATSSDFGYNGGRPSHPELLDFLAGEFVANKWSVKSMHRLILLSGTFRQASAPVTEGLAKDAGTRWLWRYPPRRLEAEAIRDSVLSASGKLDLRAGGPGFDLFEPNSNYVKVFTPKKAFGPAEFRRMIYQQKPRMQLDDTFGAFDCPDGGQIAPKRNASTTPLQALNLLNSAFAVQLAGHFAERIEKDVGKSAEAQVQRAFQLTFQRDPTAKESAGAVKLVNEHGLAALGRALLNANEFLYAD